MRLDQAVAARFPEISRRKAKELIAARRVLVNERPVTIASREIDVGARIAIVEEPPALTILRESGDWLAVDKPAGLPTQPPEGRKRISLEELLRVQFGEIYLVHRLDTPTSGVVIFARSRAAAARLSELFASRAIRKTYVAVVAGTIDHEMTIDSLIGGKEAVTIVRPRREIVGREPSAVRRAAISTAHGVRPTELDCIEAEILTGRTHQIRVHLASAGHPVAGDRRYGGPAAARLMLHAWRLEQDEIGMIEAPLPAVFGIGSAQ